MIREKGKKSAVVIPLIKNWNKVLRMISEHYVTGRLLINSSDIVSSKVSYLYVRSIGAP